MHLPSQGPNHPRTTFTLVTLSFALACAMSGCGGYCPLRWPRRDLWAPQAVEAYSIATPGDLSVSSRTVEQRGVTVSAALLTRQQAVDSFGLDVLRHNIQPIFVTIENGSGDAYRFDKASVGGGTIPAERVARLARVHPTRMIARYLRWVVFILPGVVFDTVIEPATTFEFPGIEEAARRPPVPDARRITMEFVAHELVDGTIPPGSSRMGMLFLRPMRLGSVIPVTLVNVGTKQPVTFELPTPPPVYTQAHEYVFPYEETWAAALKVAQAIKSWQVRSADPSSGSITARAGLKALWWSNATQMTLSVRQVADHRTQVALESTLRGSTSAAYGTHSRTIETFFEALDRMLPSPQAKRGVQSDGAWSSSRERAGDGAGWTK